MEGCRVGSEGDETEVGLNSEVESAFDAGKGHVHKRASFARRPRRASPSRRVALTD